MQWQTVWSEDLGASIADRSSGNGLTVFAADTEFRSKLIHRFAVNITGDDADRGGIGFLYPVPQRLGRGAMSPVAPAFHIVMHSADWRIGAAMYGQWFSEQLQPRQPPSWLNNIQINMQGVEGPDPLLAVRQNISFADWLLGSLITTEADMIEPAGWWQSVIAHYHHNSVQALDGEYWPPRSDMGGLDGLKHAIYSSQEVLGRRICLYVCAAEVANLTEANSGGANLLFNTTEEIIQWASFSPDGEVRPGDAGTVRMCRGWKQWQQQVALFVSRIVRELRPACVRLDCMKEPAENCYNSHHKHSSPLDVVQWNFELVKRVREAIDSVPPEPAVTIQPHEVLLMTEGQHEAYYAAGAGGALTEIYAGTEPPPMRLALPGYWAVPWGPNAGQIEAGTAGWAAAQTNALRREFPYVECDADFLPCTPGTPDGTRYGTAYRRGFPVRPQGYPPNSYGPPILWHALRETFASTLFPGNAAEAPPLQSQSGVELEYTRSKMDGTKTQSAGRVRALPMTSPPLVVPPIEAQSDWHGRVLTDAGNQFAVIVGGNWNGSGSAAAATTSLSVRGLQLCCGGVSVAYYTDANLTRLWKRIMVAADESEPETETGTGNRLVNRLKLVVPSAFGATFLPTRAAPALVIAPSLQPPANASDIPAWSGLSLENIPWPLHWDLSADESYVDIDLDLFAPWRLNTT